ncbi:hypothetical protein C8R43DRAFT_1113555 [Mycena crocata]|nr:hypothetical protein C8R43DRAFT_1113555 [Mycena crocata]
MLPPEIMDAALDFLHSDSAALSACTLVCRDWLPSARFHLLSQLALDATTVESFFEDFVDTTSSLHKGVMLPKFTAKGLGDVRALRIHGLDLSTVPSKFPQALPNLQTLCLEAFEAESFGAIAAIISGFPLLQSLTLSGDWDGDEMDTEAVPVNVTIPKLAHLDLDCPLKTLFGWFLSLDPVPVTSSLVLRDIWAEESPSITRYFTAAGDSLEFLTLTYPRKDALHLHLPPSTNVRSLTYECYSPSMVRLVSATLLRPHPNSRLEDLYMNFFGMHPGFPSILELNQWAQLDQTLSEVQLPNLRKIHFRGLQRNMAVRLLPKHTALITTGY